MYVLNAEEIMDENQNESVNLNSAQIDAAIPVQNVANATNASEITPPQRFF